MPYVVGIVLSLGVALFARRVGFDRDRAFYPTVLIVIGWSLRIICRDARISSHGAPGVTGDDRLLDCGRRRFKSNAWIVVGGLAGHGVFDALHGNVLKTQGCRFGGEPFVSRMTSGRQVALPGS